MWLFLTRLEGLDTFRRNKYGLTIKEEEEGFRALKSLFIKKKKQLQIWSEMGATDVATRQRRGVILTMRKSG